MEKRFYMVFSDSGGTPPKVRHKTHQEAHAAAQLMAKKHPQQTFYVMKKEGAPIRAASSPPPSDDIASGASVLDGGFHGP